MQKMNNKHFFDRMYQERYFEALKTLNVNNINCNEIVHYTSTAVLEALLSSGIMRATNVFYANDSVEYQIGIKVLQNVFKEDENILGLINELSAHNDYNWPGVFTLSFASKSDELQHWVTYGKESGVSIEFDTIPLRKERDNPNNVVLCQRYVTDDRSYISEVEHFYPIKYINPQTIVTASFADDVKNAFKQAAQLVHETCESNCDSHSGKAGCWLKKTSNKEYAAGFLILLLSYYKSESFKGEVETRASFLPAFDHLADDIANKICYLRQDNGILRPYIEVLFAQTKDDYSFDVTPAIPIKTITVGPSGTQAKVYASIVHRLKYGDTKCVWDCDEDTMQKRLGDWLQQVTNDYCPYDCKKEEFAKHLLHHWNVENGKKYCVATDQVDIFSITKCGERSCYTTSKIIVDCADEAWHSNYLSKHGIWVKRSKVEYLF